MDEDDVEQLLKGTVEELDRLLSAKNVLGAPIEREGVTVIPIVGYSFGFGAGGSAVGAKGSGGGTGAGGGIRPLGAIIIDARGARVEGLGGPVTTLVSALGTVVTRAFDAAVGRAQGEGKGSAPAAGS